MRPSVSRNMTKSSPRRRTSLGWPPGLKSPEKPAAIQYRRNHSPAGVSGPILQISSFRSVVSISSLLIQFHEGHGLRAGLQYLDWRDVAQRPITVFRDHVGLA